MESRLRQQATEATQPVATGMSLLRREGAGLRFRLRRGFLLRQGYVGRVVGLAVGRVGAQAERGRAAGGRGGGGKGRGRLWEAAPLRCFGWDAL